MNSETLLVYLPGLVLFVGGIGFVMMNVVLSHLLHPHVRRREKYIAYECGEDPVGNAWVSFNHRFYLVALIFVIFDVEVVLLFPWVVVYQSFRWFALVEVLVFLLILVVGYAYAWARDALLWDKPRPRYTSAGDALTLAASGGESDHEAVA